MLRAGCLLVALFALSSHGSPKLLETGDAVVKSASELKELLDDKTNEQVLELIVKIAEQPATWRQIHRVLETLEANNAAYSQRVDPNRNAEVNWLIKRTDRPGDKRNDVPDDKPVNGGTSTTEANFLSIESEFRRWREALFASTAIDSNEDLISAHPQYFASSSESTTVTDLPIPVEQLTTSYPALPSPDSQQHSEELRLEKKFEERLNEIEDELRRLTKLSQMLPFQIKRLKSNVYIDQTSLRGKVERTSTNSNGSEKKDISDYESRRSRFRPGHAKFHYHRVESRNSEKVSLDRLVGSEFWNRVASLKQNDTFSNPLAKRNAIVAVSLGPLPPTVSRKEDIQNNNNQDQLMQATEPLGLTSGPTKLCKKKCHVGFKKQRQRKNRIDNTGAKVEKSQMLR